jgi:hypothetical protein
MPRKKTASKYDKAKRTLSLPQKLLLPVIGIGFLIMGVAILYQATLINFLKDDVDRLVKQDFSRMVQSGILASVNDAVVDTKESKIYIPEARLSLPLDKHTRTITYNHYVDEKSGEEFVTIGRRSINYRSPNLEPGGITCSRLFELTNKHTTQDGFTKIFEKALNDGRIFHAYQNTDPECQSIYEYEELDKFILPLQAIQSY